MKTYYIPALITLSAGAVDCLLAIRNHLGLLEMLTELLIVLIIFYVVGVVVRIILDRNFPLEEGEAPGDGQEPQEGEEVAAGEEAVAAEELAAEAEE